jgi:hypothetical protein
MLEERGQPVEAPQASMMAAADDWPHDVVIRHKQPDPPKIYARFPVEKCVAAETKINRTILAKEVRAAVRKGSDDSAAGQDNVSYAVLKMFDEPALVTLTNFFNACLRLRRTPKEWSSGLIRVMFKGDDPTDVTATSDTANF